MNALAITLPTIPPTVPAPVVPMRAGAARRTAPQRPVDPREEAARIVAVTRRHWIGSSD